MSARRIVLALTAAAAVGLAPLPAYADTFTTRDAARDVLSQGIDDDIPTKPEPNRIEGDALAMRVTHGPQRVRITLRTAQLTRDPATSAVHVFGLRTNEARRAELTIYVHGKHWQGERTWRVNGRERTCHGLRSRIDYEADTVRVVVPRRCLSNPRWVRAGGGSGVLTGDRLYADDVSLDGRIGDDVAFGPRIRRG